tara:strand:+ start:346 stop:540 length:195 start_codon:yes stop_codon:yes gene_type:complete
MNIDGEKLLDELHRKIGLLWRQIKSDVECDSFDSISSKYASIRDYEKVIRLIETGDYTTKDGQS